MEKSKNKENLPAVTLVDLQKNILVSATVLREYKFLLFYASDDCFRKDGSVWFARGARGKPRIIKTVLLSVSNVIDHYMNIRIALHAPRIHHQWCPDHIFFEPVEMPSNTHKILENKDIYLH